MRDALHSLTMSGCIALLVSVAACGLVAADVTVSVDWNDVIKRTSTAATIEAAYASMLIALISSNARPQASLFCFETVVYVC